MGFQTLNILVEEFKFEYRPCKKYTFARGITNLIHD